MFLTKLPHGFNEQLLLRVLKDAVQQTVRGVVREDGTGFLGQDLPDMPLVVRQIGGCAGDLDPPGDGGGGNIP